ncbi:hypothetical protein, partial [Chlorobaculum sp. 24CR]|uniref:hypothetical protein n=1 Tax=Chlorobaculum sp. 24CR TaxID=2508878 RepID=UPI001ADD1B78
VKVEKLSIKSCIHSSSNSSKYLEALLRGSFIPLMLIFLIAPFMPGSWGRGSVGDFPLFHEAPASLAFVLTRKVTKRIDNRLNLQVFLDEDGWYCCLFTPLCFLWQQRFLAHNTLLLLLRPLKLLNNCPGL